MNSKKLVAVLSVLALALALSLTMFGGGKARAAVGCSVPSLAYPSIQSAANDAGCTTINVAPGTYNENVLVNNSTTINGAQAGNNDFATRNATPANESTVNGVTPTGAIAVFRVNAANVTINGFTIKNTVTGGAAMGITVSGGGNGAAILNNIIDTINTPDTGSNGTAQAIYLTSGGPDGVNITNNEMKNIQSNRSAKGVLVGDNGGTNPSLNTVIQGNSIYNVTSTAKGAYGVSVANVTPGTSGFQVLNNTISNLIGSWVHAIGLEGNTPGVLVTGNSITGLSSPGPDVIAVWFEANPSFSTASVTTNNFDVGPAVYGIAVDPSISGTGVVDGTCNWWGAPNGPGPVGSGNGAKVSPRVKYSPWSTSPEPAGDCNGSIVANKNQCKDSGWETLFRANGTGFKNQGDCIQYVNTGK
jgi:hypothetical protein